MSEEPEIIFTCMCGIKSKIDEGAVQSCRACGKYNSWVRAERVVDEQSLYDTTLIESLIESQEPKPMYMNRESILNGAMSAVMQDRNTSYGDPEDNFRDIAAMWNTYLSSNQEEMLIKPHDVAAMMILVKVSRLKTSPGKEDHWLDIAGYAACGGQAYSNGESNGSTSGT